MRKKGEGLGVSAKHDWQTMRAEYLSGPWLSLRSFIRDKGLNDKIVWVQTRGWVAEKKAMKQQIIETTKERVIDEDVRDINTIRLRQARLARFLQLKGIEAVKDQPIENVEDARRFIVSGLQEERRALGMEGGGNTNLTQININPKTNLDKLVEGLNYEGILKLIADLKRERAGRSLPKSTSDSTGTVEEGETV
jgi:hypothetical protein